MGALADMTTQGCAHFLWGSGPGSRAFELSELATPCARTERWLPLAAARSRSTLAYVAETAQRRRGRGTASCQVATCRDHRQCPCNIQIRRPCTLIACSVRDCAAAPFHASVDALGPHPSRALTIRRNPVRLSHSRPVCSTLRGRRVTALASFRIPAGPCVLRR